MKRHLRFVPRFLSISFIWLNLLERWFGELTAKALRRSSYGSVADLEFAIAQFPDAWNHCDQDSLLVVMLYNRFFIASRHSP